MGRACDCGSRDIESKRNLRTPRGTERRTSKWNIRRLYWKEEELIGECMPGFDANEEQREKETAL